MTLKSLIKLMRPHQYIKNIFIFLPLFFALKITNIVLFGNAFIAFVAFSLVSSAVYILNDYFDIVEDRLHPRKKDRPLASGLISNFQAMVTMLILTVGGFSLITLLPMSAIIYLSIYVLINIAYSSYLKHVAIVDVTIIAVGFVIRLFVGSIATGVPLSMWIVIMTFLLALFIALAKRRDDVIIFNKTGKKMRKAIDGYNVQLLDISMAITASVVIVTYILFATSLGTVEKFNSQYVYLTSIFVIVGIMRYLQIVFVNLNSGSPTTIILKDRFIQTNILAWIASFFWILY
jgi:4-hydroxybenzoate polyprenyltransferase